MSSLPNDLTTMAPGMKRPGLAVILGGLVTSAIALALVSLACFASEGDISLMGYYMMYFIPISAIGVGFLAGSGYGLVSLWQGIRVPWAILALVFALMVAAYFVAQYLEYLAIDPHWDDGTKISFWAFFDYITQSFTYSTGIDSDGAEPLGKLGYLLRGLEVLGFSAGGLFPLLLLRTVRYCDTCQRYMRSQQVCFLPVSKDIDTVAKEAEAQAALRRQGAPADASAESTLDQLMQAVADNDAMRLNKLIEPLQAAGRKTKKLLRRIRIDLNYCPTCHNGLLVLKRLEGKGRHMQTTPVGEVPVTAKLVQGLCSDKETLNIPTRQP
ncbi:hypothetical protein LCGC14_0303850 [marine sediment metagenome]|uniref:Uncharacterized protein n=1 Tax=marine sediment metagenome TaxID=412755 RepID=A0A0F9TPI3_9ZZZZ|nr:hypothetical protein [Phycisphaerae bacterium]HDZ42797.1 hypothetical protein [Phycisphaerae bacterium]